MKRALPSLHLSVQKDRKSTRLNSIHVAISYAVFCLKKKNMTSVGYIGTQTMRSFADREINAGAPGAGTAGRPLNALFGHSVDFFFLMVRLPARSTLFPYTTLFR